MVVDTSSYYRWHYYGFINHYCANANEVEKVLKEAKNEV